MTWGGKPGNLRLSAAYNPDDAAVVVAFAPDSVPAFPCCHGCFVDRTLWIRIQFDYRVVNGGPRDLPGGRALFALVAKP